MEWIRHHPYLTANIPWTVLMVVSALTVKPREYRRLILWSGLICIPGSMLALLHNRTYWNPVRLGGGPFGIEDIMFTFTAGALSFFLGASLLGLPAGEILFAALFGAGWPVYIAAVLHVRPVKPRRFKP